MPLSAWILSRVTKVSLACALLLPSESAGFTLKSTPSQRDVRDKLALLQAFIFFPGQIGWLWACVGLGAGVYWFYVGLRLLRRRQAILEIPAPKIRNATIGLVEVSGSAAGPYTMQAPLSDAPCYYYRSIVWRLKPSGKNGLWEKVADENFHLPFYLEDKSGRLLVDPQSAAIDVRRQFRRELPAASGKPELPANLASFLVRHGLDAKQKLKLEEYCIKPKDELFVMGTLAPNRGKVEPMPVQTISDDPIKFVFTGTPPEVSSTHAAIPLPPLEQPATEIVRLQGSRAPASSTQMSQQEKVAAALMRAGIASPAGWAASETPVPAIGMGSVVDGTILAGSAAGTAPAVAPDSEFDFKPKQVLRKGDDNPAFFISTRSQRDLVQSLGWKSTLMLWGGPALSLLSLFALLEHFGWM